MNFLNIKYKEEIKNKQGITLVALVITIVVLLILTGVSLNLVIGNEGILTKSKEASNKYGQQNENEQEDLDNIEYLIEGMEKPIKVAVNEKAASNGTIDGKKPNTNNPIIPEGYTPIDAEVAVWGDGGSSPVQNSVDNGLVIKDDSNNEWVWVPVEESTLSNMYVTSIKSEGETLSGDVGVTTKLYTNSTTVGKSGDIAKIVRRKPGESDFKEPDLVTEYDLKEENYKTILEFDAPTIMAEAFVTDYANMINSIKKYGGFYIGRYELSNEGVQKGKATLTNINWYNLYKKCTTLNASDEVESKMIWGIQWDLACDFISKKGKQKSIKDSRNWGNYSDSTEDAAVIVGTTKMYGSKQVTGYSEYWKANNIYDLAGNCWEWTMETYNTEYRSHIGGNCENKGRDYNVTNHTVSYTSEGAYTLLRNTSNFNNKIGSKFIC